MSSELDAYRSDILDLKLTIEDLKEQRTTLLSSGAKETDKQVVTLDGEIKATLEEILNLEDAISDIEVNGSDE